MRFPWGDDKDWRLIALTVLVTPPILLSCLAAPLMFLLGIMAGAAPYSNPRGPITMMLTPVFAIGLCVLIFNFGKRFRGSRNILIVLCLGLNIAIAALWALKGKSGLIEAYMWPAIQVADFPTK